MSKIKLLAVSDDIRMPTGVGIQLKKFLTGLQKTGRYDVVEIAGSLIQQQSQAVMFEDIKLYPIGEPYGNSQFFKFVMSQEKPDIVLAFSDPRFFEYLFIIDNEIRPKSKFVFYHTWDNAPFPKYNIPWYSACDKVVLLSKFSYELMHNNGVDCACIPHGMDPLEFYPLPADIVKKERELLFQSAKKPNTKFVIFWNNRNISRKRPGDVLVSFQEFCQTHPDSLLLMNTVPVDMEGTDILHLMHDLHIDTPVIFNFNRVNSERLNVFYNIADVTLNIAHTEGFGLCITESLCAGTPVIATRTGGMIEQMITETQTFGISLVPEVKELFGVPGMPYIYRDYVSHEQILEALDEAYEKNRHGEWKPLGLAGREHIIKNYNVQSTIEKWDELLQQVYNEPSKFERFKVSEH